MTKWPQVEGSVRQARSGDLTSSAGRCGGPQVWVVERGRSCAMFCTSPARSG